MADVINTAVYKISLDTSSVSSQLNSVENAISSSSESASTSSSKSASSMSAAWTVANTAISTVTSKVFSAVTSTISSNISKAVSRVDTLNAFPKMMAMFGVSSDEASASIERISERMQGLPTSLDVAASGVQNLFMVTKDLTEAEDLFYAVNDAAMVFANGSTDAVDNFIYSYKQSLSSGKIAAQEFNSMNEAIPGLMDKVAEVIGVTYADLKTGLSDGTISIDQFNEALKTLDSDGVGSMSSLQEGAFSATGGIQTAMDNMGNAVARGIQAVIEAIGEENIQNAISGIGSAFETVGKVIGAVIGFIAENEWAMDALLAVLIAIGLVMTATLLPTIIATTAALLANPLTWIILLVATLAMGIIELVQHFDEVTAWFGSIGEFIGGIAITIGDFFSGIWETAVEIFTNVWEFIVSVFSPIVDFFTGLFEGVWNTVSSVFDSIKTVFQNVADFFGTIWNNIVNTMSTIVGGIADTVSGIFKGVVNAVLTVAENIINAPIRAINGIISLINMIPGVNIGKIGELSLPRMASGGIVEATAGGQSVTLAEGGEDEWVVPESKMASLIDQLEKRDDSGGGDTYNIYVTGTFAVSAEERRKVADQIVEAISQNKRMRFES